MKKLLRECDRIIVLLLKTILYLALFWIFYRLYAVFNWQLLVKTGNRTMAVTILSYMFAGYLFVKIYGGYDIGKRKNKPIIISLSLAAILTDIVAYLMLSVMNTNDNNNRLFMFEQPWLLLVVIALQMFLIFVWVHFGNWAFFKIHDPERCLIITSSQRSLNEISRCVKKYRLQYNISRNADYRNENLKEIIPQYDTIFIYDVPVKERTEIAQFCYQSMKNVYINPEMADVVERDSNHVMLDDVSLLELSTLGLTAEQRFIKRTSDIIISSLALIIFSPVLLISAIAIKIEDGGPVFFKQNRATRGGKIFSVYKLRTMKQDVDNYVSTVDDDRITKVGAFLRRFRLDEIPQFLNVLGGDMSIVGPRPEMLANIFNYTTELPEFEYRLRVKAGITGYAQIAGKYNTSPRDKLVLDLMYIEEYSFWMDVKLIFQTIIVVFKNDSTEAFDVENKPPVKVEKKDHRRQTYTYRKDYMVEKTDNMIPEKKQVRRVNGKR